MTTNVICLCAAAIIMMLRGVVDHMLATKCEERLLQELPYEWTTFEEVLELVRYDVYYVRRALFLGVISDKIESTANEDQTFDQVSFVLDDYEFVDRQKYRMKARRPKKRVRWLWRLFEPTDTKLPVPIPVQ